MPQQKPREKVEGTPRRERALSREQIVKAAIELLDDNGEEGLTFRSLAERLATGSGAIYWHIANRSDLLIAACDAILAVTLQASLAALPLDISPQETIRTLALSTFDAMDAHPWIGSALTQAPGQLPVVRIIEALGQQIKALGVPEAEHWATASALLTYILGVGGRNAANGQLARLQGLNRSDFLEAVSAAWSHLDPLLYPFTRSLAAPLRHHDDREDFLAGIDLILQGIEFSRNR